MGRYDFPFGYNVPTYACMGAVVCMACNKHHGYCSEMQPTGATERDGGDHQGATDMDMSSHYDKDSKKSGKFKSRPFLKAKDIPAKGATAKIIDFREAPKQFEYSDFLMDVAVGKKEFTWGLRSKSVTLNMLIEALGKRTEKWIGKTVKLVTAGPKGQYINLG